MAFICVPIADGHIVLSKSFFNSLVLQRLKSRYHIQQFLGNLILALLAKRGRKRFQPVLDVFFSYLHGL